MSLYRVVTTQVTPVDIEEGYGTESLQEALQNDHSCYHLARIAQLYFSRTGPVGLSNQDYAEHIPKLFNKIFGEIPGSMGGGSLGDNQTGGYANNLPPQSNPTMMAVKQSDFGWLERQSGATDAPRNNFMMLRKDLIKTFDKKISRNQRAAYRLCQLLDCFEKGNFFDLIFGLDASSQRLCIYYLPDTLLPDHIRVSFQQLFGNNSSGGGLGNVGRFNGQLPELYMNLSLMQPDKIGVQRVGFLALNMMEFYLFRFFCWFRDGKVNTQPSPVATGPKTPVNSGKSGTFPTSISGLQHKLPSATPTQPRPTSKSKKGVSNLSIPDILFRCPGLELLDRYLRYFLPYDSVKTLRTEPQAYANSRSQWMFLQILLEMWFSKYQFAAIQNNPQQQGYIGQPGYGSMSYSSPSAMGQYGQSQLNQSQVGGGVTKLFLKSILILINYLFQDPMITASLQNIQKISNGANGERLEFLGITPVLLLLRPYLYHFFLRSLSVVSKQVLATSDQVAFVPLLDSWLLYLQPWKAESRARDTVIQKKKTSIMPDAAMIRSRFSDAASHISLKAAVDTVMHSGENTSGVGGTAGTSAENAARQGGTSAPKSPKAAAGKKKKAECSLDYVWFVVQNYFIYAHLLQVVFKRLQDHSVSEAELKALVRAFSKEDEGAFNEIVISVLLACEIIIDDAVQMKQTSIFNRLAESNFSFLFSGASNFGGTATTSEAASNTPKGRLAQTVSSALNMLESNRFIAVNILKKQFAELRWDVAMTPLPRIQGSQLLVGNILQQMDWQYKNKIKKKKGAHGNGGLGGKAFQWAGNQFATHSPVNMISNMSILHPMASSQKLSEEQLLKLTMDRMFRIFEVPPIKDKTSNKKETSSTAAGKNCPESILSSSSPPWLAGQVQCVYRRLTTKGRQQLVGGNYDAKSSLSYIGDTLVNPPPICTYEMDVLVRVFYKVSVVMNSLFGLDASAPVRFNLRFLADMRLLMVMNILTVIIDGIFVGYGLVLPSLSMFTVIMCLFFFKYD